MRDVPVVEEGGPALAGVESFGSDSRRHAAEGKVVGRDDGDAG